MQGQLKSNPRLTRKSSRNAAPSPGTSESKPVVMSGQPLSPAKKLAKLMRERPLKKLPVTPSAGASKTLGKNNSNIEKKQNTGLVHNPGAKGLPTSKESNKTKKPVKLSSSKHDLAVSARASGTAPMKNGKCSSRGAPSKTNVTNDKPRKDANPGNTSAKKRSKHDLTSVEDKRPKKEKATHGHHSSSRDEHLTDHGPSTSSSVKKRHSKKHRPKAERDASKAAPDAAAAAAGDIAALLRLGEGAAADTPMSDDSDWEAVDTHTSDLVTKGFVEVTLPSDVSMQKKKKKGFDVEAYMKRQLSRVYRELQQLVHKTHLLCLLSRALQLNALLNSETQMACAMSMLPSKYAYPPKRVSLSYVERFLKWFREKVPLEAPAEGQRPPEDVFRTLEARLRTKKAYSALELVCLFVLILRAIGVDCRLVMSLQPVPLKPGAPPSAAAASKTAKTTVEKSGKSASKSKQHSVTKQDTGKGAKPSSSGRKAVSAAGTSKAKRAAPTPPSRTGSGRKARQRAGSAAAPAGSSDDSSGDEFEPRRPDRRVLSSSSGSEGTSGGAGRPARAATDHWAEVYVEEELRWISVDVVGGGVHCVSQIRKRATAPMVYVLGCDNAGHVKELTPRYDPKWHSSTRKLRVDSDWWQEAIGAWRAAPTRRDREEEEELLQDLQERPMPQSIAEFKDHPLYALERHLLKFEAIYPPSSVPLGYIGKGERRSPVYARECVCTLHARETWIKQARVVKEGEKPYKIVKARPKWDKMLQKAITDKPLEVFGRWQTEDYVPPSASGGKVPRNAYGNVELFKPSMLPGGTVHLKVEGLSRVAKKLCIDCAPAMVGWDYHCGGSHPVFEGYVICEEFEDTLMDAWEADQQEARRRRREKREKRILDNWRRLVRGLFIRQRLARKYDFQDEQSGHKRPAASDQPATSKKARTTADKHEPKLEPKIEATLPPNLESKVKAEPAQGRATKAVAKSEPKPAAKLSAKLKAAQAAKQTPKEEPKVEEEVPESQEEVARRVEASMASMALRRVALSSDSEAESDAEGAAAKTGTAAGAAGGSETAAAVKAKLSMAVPAGSVKSSAPAAAQRKRRAAPAARRRARKASPASRSPSPTPAAAGAAGRASRRRSARVAAVSYREMAGSGSDAEGDIEAPLRDDDLTSDEEQPFVRAAERAAASSDDDDDLIGF